MKVFAKTAFSLAMLTLVSAPFAATSSASVSPQEREKIEAVVHDYLLRKPEVMIEVMEVLQKKQYAKAEQTIQQTQQTAGTFAKALFQQKSDPVIGNPNGQVTVVEFFDYQCPHCVDMAPVMVKLAEANPNLRVIFKEFPIRGDVSEFAARAALAANKQGKYIQLNHALLQSSASLNKDTIIQIAKDKGLNVDQLKKDMESDAIKNQLKSNIKLAQDLKLFGTPAIFIGKTDANGKDKINYVPGQADQAKLQAIVDETK